MGNHAVLPAPLDFICIQWMSIHCFSDHRVGVANSLEDRLLDLAGYELIHLPSEIHDQFVALGILLMHLSKSEVDIPLLADICLILGQVRRHHVRLELLRGVVSHVATAECPDLPCVEMHGHMVLALGQLFSSEIAAGPGIAADLLVLRRVLNHERRFLLVALDPVG